METLHTMLRTGKPKFSPLTVLDNGSVVAKDGTVVVPPRMTAEALEKADAEVFRSLRAAASPRKSTRRPVFVHNSKKPGY